MEIRFLREAGDSTHNNRALPIRTNPRIGCENPPKLGCSLFALSLSKEGGYSRAQVKSLVARSHGNRLVSVRLAKRCGAQVVPFARK